MSVTQATLLGNAFSNTQASGAIPIGGIIMWSGTIATIPTGWSLCNGSNGTPDLTNRFIIGASTDTPEQSQTTVTGSGTKTGGLKDAIVVSHTHIATTTISPIAVLSSVNGGPTILEGAPVGTPLDYGTATSATTSVADAGSSGTNANLPPYYALAFIMRIS